MHFPRVSTLKTAQDFRNRLNEIGVDLPFDEEIETGPDATLAKPLATKAGTIGNRFAILPMEGWDGTSEGKPSDLTHRRWANFGRSGAKLIWGGEAVAVRRDPHISDQHMRKTSLSTFPYARSFRQGLSRALQVLAAPDWSAEPALSENRCLPTVQNPTSA